MALFLIDYPRRQRLRIMARGEVSDAGQRPDLIEQLEVVDYRARIERAVIYHIEALDWNCPQHITPRWTEEEFALAIEEWKARVAQLEAENRRLREQSADP